jgi:PAS domain S-box-containing protein
LPFSNIRTVDEIYSKLISSLDDGYVRFQLLFDDRGNVVDLLFVEVNPAFEKRFGLKPSDVIGKTVKTLDPNLEQYWIEYADLTCKSGKTQRYENYLEIAKAYFEVQSISISNNEIALLFKDITSRKKAEEALKESAQLYETLFDNTEDVFLIVEPLFDEQGKLIDFQHLKVNQAFETQIGVKASDLLGKTAKQIYGDLESGWLENFEKVIRSGRPMHLEWFIKGNNRWFDLLAFPYLKGQIGVLFREITEQKKIEEDYKQLFDSMDEQFQLLEVMYHKDGSAVNIRYLEVNPAFLRLAGKSREQIIGRTTTDIFGLIEDFTLETLSKVAKTGKASRFLNPVKETNQYFECYAWKIPYASNLVAVLSSDITSRVLVEEKLREKDRLAAIGETAGMVGHDLRNPLQSIVGEVYLAKEELAQLPECEHKDSLRQSIDAIDEQISYMDKIVSDLQTFVKPVEVHRKAVDLKSLVESVLEQISIQNNIHIHFDMGQSMLIQTDSHLLKRVLINLITNAIQAMPKGGDLTIDIKTVAGRVQIWVEDTGVGISEDIKPKIFSPLFTTKAKGQGFGLAVCKRVIEAQGGTITFESKEGKGTKFIVKLPLN